MDRRLIDGRRFPYFVVEDLYLDDGHAARMGAEAWIVFCVILRHAHKDGSSPPSLTEMMRVTGLSRPTVVKYCKRLVRMGYVGHEVRKGGRGGRIGVYTVMDLVSVPTGKPDEPRSKKRGSPGEPLVVNDVNQSGKRDEPLVVNAVAMGGSPGLPQNAIPPTTPLSRELNGTKKQQQERTADAAAASAAPGPEKTDADRAMLLLALEGIDQAAAAALVAGRGENALAAVEAAIRRADHDQPRNRAGWIVTAIRDGWAGLPPVRAANTEDPEARRKKVLGEHATHTMRREQEQQRLLREESEITEWLASLPADEHARLLAAARETYPMCRGKDFTNSPILRGWAAKQGLLTSGRKV